VIVVVAGYILYSNIKKKASGDCGCGNGCKDCNHSCDILPSNEKDKKIE